jgi:thiol:disulfide interchange protein
MDSIRHFPGFRAAQAFAAALLLFCAAGARADTFPAPDQAKADIKAAVAKAAAEHKRVLVDFGANWCPDCKALSKYLQAPDNAALLDADYVLVRVNVGYEGITRNFDVARGYGIPLKKGVPALAVLDESGNAVYAQKNGEFESMRTMDPHAVHAFLVRWRP